MSGHYKLVIQNKQKNLLKEDLMQYSFKQHVLPIFQDLYKASTNIFKATIISVGATVEYRIISRNIKGFASLKSINKKFQEKIEEASKLYTESVPESVRGDVDLLFGMTNPAATVATRLIDTTLDSKGLDTYIPFFWFTKYFFTKGEGGFFSTDVEKWGDLFGFKFNNIIWYKGFIYKDLIIDNVKFLEEHVYLLDKSHIEMFKGIDTIEKLEAKFESVALFLKCFKLFEAFCSPVVEFYNFAKKWDADRMLDGLKVIVRREMKEIQYNNETDINKRTDIQKEIEKLRQEQKILVDEFVDDVTQKGKIIFEHEINLVPKLMDILLGFEGADQVSSKVYSVLCAVVNVPIDKINEVLDKTPIIKDIGWRLPRMSGTSGGGSGNGGSGNGGSGNGGSNNSGSGNNSGNVNNSGNNGNNAPIEINLHNDARLIIKKNQKMLKEDKNNHIKIQKNVENKVNISEDDLSEIQELGLNQYKPNGAEEIVIKNLMSDKKIGKYAKQWLEFVKISNQIKNKPKEKRKELFFKMLRFSLKYFNLMQQELQDALIDIKNNPQSDIAQKVSSELNKKYDFEMTPQGFAKKTSYDFELLCNINTIYVGSYLINIQFVFEKNQVIYRFLKERNVDDARLLINNLRNNIIQKLTLDESLVKKFEGIGKEAIKVFGEKSRTIEIFQNAQQDLHQSIDENKTAIIDFCNDFIKVLEDFNHLSEFDKLNKLNDMISEYDATLQINLNQIYNSFLPALKTLKDNFNVNLKQKKDEFQKEFDELLDRMDLQSFDKIYTDNKIKFEEKYNNCIKYTGLNKDGSKLIANLTELKNIQKDYQEKIKSYTDNLTKNQTGKEKDTNNKITPVDAKKEKATLKIDTNSINPVSVNTDEEQGEEE